MLATMLPMVTFGCAGPQLPSCDPGGTHGLSSQRYRCMILVQAGGMLLQDRIVFRAGSALCMRQEHARAPPEERPPSSEPEVGPIFATGTT